MRTRRALTSAALVLALLGLVLPPEGGARFLVGADSPRLVDVVDGVRWLKGLLVLNAVLLVLLGRFGAASRDGEPLLAGTGVTTAAAGKRERLFVGGLVAVALVLRLVGLGAGLWFDEIDTLVHYARLPLGELLTLFDSRNNHLFFSVLSSVSVSLFGDGAAGLRMPAALFGTGGVWALWWFGRRVTGPREALFATALLAFSYHHVHFSQNARGYTGMLFFTLVGSGVFLTMLLRRRAGGAHLALGYGLCMALAVFTHSLAVMAVAAHGVVWLALLLRARGGAVARRRWLPAWGLLFAGTFALLFYALVLPQYAALIAQPPKLAAQTVWKSPLWMVTETLRGLAAGLPGGWAAVAGAVLVGVFGVVSYARRSVAVLALLLLGTLLTGASVVALKMHLWPRFFFLFAGFFVLIACRGVCGWLELLLRRVDERRRGLAVTCAAALVVVASAATVPRAYAPKQDFEGALAYVTDASEPGAAVATTDMAAFVLDEHLHAGSQSVATAAELRAVEAGHASTWFLYTFPTRLEVVHPDLWEHLQAHYTLQRVFPGTIRGGEIVVLRR